MAKLLRLYVFIFSVFKGNFSFKRWCANIWHSLHISFANNNFFDPFNISAIRCSRFGRIFLWLLLTANCLLASAQSFPVQLIPQVTPPPPIYFSQYADASTTNSSLRLQIILNDLEINNREIRLKAYFQGNGISFQSNDVVVGSSPLFLEGGVPLVLTNAELAPYFRFENITGISPNVYGQAIPEGAYQFCYEVYDVLTGNRLSQKSCAISVVFQNEPPFLISPRNKTLVAENNPQNIVFQWTPRSINVSNVEYELSLVEIWDTQIDPQAAFLSSPPVFQTTTTATTYVYGPSDPLLLSGKNYAWRIQAKAKQGAEEIGLFKNQGYSEIFSFSYAGSCDLPLGIDHEVKGSTNANIFWDDFSTDVPEYTIRYRQKGNTNEWFLNKTTTNQTTLWDLKAGTTYEYQLQKKCVVTGSEWSVTKQFTTFLADNEASVYQCGITPNFSLTNKEPLPKINTGETFVAGDFPISVLEVSGSNGRFTGKGYVTIPYLNSIRVGVKFTNVLINTDKQMSEGTVVTVYDPNLGSILDVDEVVETMDTISDLVAEPFEGDNDLDEMRVNFMIPRDSVGNYIKIKDGMVTITNPENGASISEPLGDDKVVVDGEGQVYHIDTSGEIRDGGQIDSGGAVTSNNVEGISTNGQLERLTAKDIQITFKEVPGDFGFDEIPSTANASIKKEYTTILDADGNDYTLAHQAVENGQTAYVDAIIEQTGSNQYALDSIVFKTKQGEKIPVEIRGNNTIRLTLKGRYTFENEIIYAVVPSMTDRTKQLTAGAFTLWHMTDRPVDVVLVEVGNGQVPSGVETQIADIFKKGVANINLSTIQTREPFDSSVLGPNGQLDIGDSGWLTNYNDKQKAVISDLKSKIDYKSDNYYIFVFGSDLQPTKSIGGFMPLQRQFGFIFTGDVNSDEEGKGDLAMTIAHEIGHGVFALQHPFTRYGSSEGATDWLMDYKKGNVALSHMDWAQLHNPDLKFYVFQDEEDGEIAGRKWFTPDWKAFSLGSNSTTIINGENGTQAKGTVPGFKLKNGDRYYAQFTGNTFKGYFRDNDNKKFPIENYLKKPEDKDDVYLFEIVPNDCNKIYSAKFSYVDNNKSSILFTSDNTEITRIDIVKNCVSDLCAEGKKFYDAYYPKVSEKGSDELTALRNISQLICSTGSDKIDYDVLVGQIYKDKADEQARFWWGRDQYLFDLVSELFWDSDKAFELYYKTLIKVKSNISSLNATLQPKEGTEPAKVEDYYDAILFLDDEVLKKLPNKAKVKIIAYILKEDTFITSGLFGITNDNESLIIKVLNSIEETKTEATVFMDEFIEVDDLYDDLQAGLDDNLDSKNFTDFILKLSKLAELAYGNGDTSQIKPKYTFTWGVKNLDFVLKWVSTLGDYRFSYIDNNILLTGKCTSSYMPSPTGVGIIESESCLIDKVLLNPFKDFIQITIIESVNILPALCNNKETQFCGKAIVVPAIFLEYLNAKKENKQFENLGLNIVTVAGTILTGGELAAAKVGSAVWIWAASDLVYTFSDPVAKLFREDIEKATSKEFADNFYLGWDAIGLVFQIKSVADLSGINKANISKSIASKEVLGDDKFYKTLENSIRKKNPGLTDAQVKETVEETKKAMNQIKSELPPEVLDEEIARAKKLLGNGVGSALRSVSKSSKALIVDNLPDPAGLFRQFAIKVEDQVKNLRAANFAKKADDSFNHFRDLTGKFYIKHNPNTGEVLLIDAIDKKFLAYAMDEVYDSQKFIQNATVNEFENLLAKWKTIKGLNDIDEILVNGKRIKLPRDKITLILGKYEILNNPNNYMTTEVVLQELGLNHLKYWELSKDLLPSSQRIHMLNVPKNTYIKDTWWTSYNAQLIEDIAKNPSKYNVVILTDVVKPNYIDELKVLGGAYEVEILELSKDFDFISKDDFWSIKNK